MARGGALRGGGGRVRQRAAPPPPVGKALVLPPMCLCAPLRPSTPLLPSCTPRRQAAWPPPPPPLARGCPKRKGGADAHTASSSMQPPLGAPPPLPNPAPTWVPGPAAGPWWAPGRGAWPSPRPKRSWAPLGTRPPPRSQTGGGAPSFRVLWGGLPGAAGGCSGAGAVPAGWPAG